MIRGASVCVIVCRVQFSRSAFRVHSHTLPDSNKMSNNDGALFNIKVADLDITPGKTPAKEMLIVRVIRVREGQAGKTAKWECDLIDADRPESVLLVDAWGKNIALAKAKFTENKVYKIKSYAVINKGKSIPFGNNTIKITITPEIVIEAVGGDHPLIPSDLPTENLADVVELKAPRVTSLILAVETSGMKKEITIKRTGVTKIVTNNTMKAQSVKIAFAAWDTLADQISGRTGDFRLDAVLVTPALGADSVKISTLDFSTIRPATTEQSEMLHQTLAADGALQALTKETWQPRREIAMNEKASIANLELIAMSLAAESDAIRETYEIPSVMVMNFAGTDPADEKKLTYKACPSCHFKKLDDNGKCSKCQGTAFEERHLVLCTIGDPTASVEGIMYHEAAKECLAMEDIVLKPLVALTRVEPDNRNAGKHVLEIYALKPMFSVAGVLNVFRAPTARFHVSGDKVIPVVPDDVKANAMSQTIVHDTFCSYVRVLLRITSQLPDTQMQNGVDGMRCEHTAQCCISSTTIALVQTGSFDTVAPLYRLVKKNLVHAVCSFIPGKRSKDLPIFKPLKIYVFQDEDPDTVIKTFKFEVEQVREHFSKSAVAPEAINATPLKAVHNSPGWSSPTRRLKVRKTDDASAAGLTTKP